ncbi:hypothetical protein TNCV_1005751 [Trichonephila clavipes]|nr:hypothetical protein TNCV_1005751 [Trichonephila clavipes]
MADCEVEGTIASPRSIPSERAMSPTGERSDEGRNIRTRQNPLGPQERQTRIDRAFVMLLKKFVHITTDPVEDKRFCREEFVWKRNQREIKSSMERNATEGQNIPVMGVQQETSGL